MQTEITSNEKPDSLLETSAKNINNEVFTLIQKNSYDFESFKNLIIQSPFNINQTNNDLMTPLHYICQNINIKIPILKFLHERGANFEAKDKYGRIPMHYLCQNQNVDYELVSTYISLARDDILDSKDNSGCTPFYILCSNTDNVSIDFFKNILHHHKNIVNEGKNALFYILHNKHIKTDYLNLLHEKGYNFNALINEEGETLLFEALRNNAIDSSVIETIICNGCNVNLSTKKGETILHFLCKQSEITDNTLKNLDILLSHGLDINSLAYEESETAIHVACKNQKISIPLIKYLINHGCDYKIKTKISRMTAIHYAVLNPEASIEYIEYLVSFGFDIFATTEPNNETVISCALKNTKMSLPIIKYLYENIPNNNNYVTLKYQDYLELALKNPNVTQEIIIYWINHGYRFKLEYFNFILKNETFTILLLNTHSGPIFSNFSKKTLKKIGLFFDLFPKGYFKYTYD